MLDDQDSGETSKTTRIRRAAPPTEQPKVAPQPVATRIEQAETRIEQAEVRIEHAEVRIEHAEVRTEHAEVRAEHAETRAEHAEKRAEHAETRAERVETTLQLVVDQLRGSITPLLESVPMDRVVDQKCTLDQLTGRQRKVLTLIAEGQNTKQIGMTLKVSPKTVEYHRRKVMDRLNMHDIPGLVRFALRAGLIPPGD